MSELWIPCGTVKVHTRITGEGEPLVLFHGWGGEIDSWAPVIRHYEQTRKVYACDLPGFGKSDKPAEPWGSGEYAEAMEIWFRELGLSGVDAMGHSHGGRVLLRLTAEHPELVNRLVLVDAAGLVPKRKPSYYCKVWSYKAAKKVANSAPLAKFLKKLGWDAEETVKKRSGSADYRDADPVMRGTLVRVVNENLRPLLPKIKASTLCVWGSADTATPLYMGEILSREIPDAGLCVLEGAGHFSYLDCFGQFIRITDVFFKLNEGAH